MVHSRQSRTKRPFQPVFQGGKQRFSVLPPTSFRKGRELAIGERQENGPKSPCLSDHSFTIRHLGLYPSAFLFAILRVFFEVKSLQCLYCRIHRVNPDAPKSPFLRFIHSVFQSPGTLSTAPLPATLDIASYAYSAPICVTAIHSKSLARSLQNLLRAVYEFTFVLEPKVFCQSFVQVLPILAGQMDVKRVLWH